MKGGIEMMLVLLMVSDLSLTPSAAEDKTVLTDRLTSFREKYNPPNNATEKDKSDIKFGSPCTVSTNMEMDECLNATLKFTELEDGTITVLPHDWIDVLECVGGKCSCLSLDDAKTSELAELYSGKKDKVCIFRDLKSVECVDQQECADNYHCLPNFVIEKNDMFKYTSVRFCTAAGIIPLPKNGISLLLSGLVLYCIM